MANEGSDVSAIAPATDAPTAHVEPPGHKRPRRRNFTALFSLLAVAYAATEMLHGGLEKHVAQLTAFELSLKQVDIIGLTGAFVDGVRTNGPDQLSWWAPWAATWAGFGGMWDVMRTGGWLTMTSGLLVIVSGIALAALAASQSDSEHPWLQSSAQIVAVAFFAVVVGWMGIAVNVFVVPLVSSTPPGAWITQNQSDLAALVFPPAPAPVFTLPSSSFDPDGIGALLRSPPSASATPVAPLHGNYRAAAHELGGFFRDHWLFGLEIVLVGSIAAAIVWGLSAAMGIYTAGIFVPFAILGVITLGAAIALVVDHVIGAYAVKLLIAFAAAPFGLVALGVVLDSGHMAITVVESTQKLLGRE